MIDCSSYWFQRGYFADGLDVAAAAERSPWASRSRLYARLTNLSAWCALRNGDFIKAKSGAKLAVRIAFERGSALDLIRALNTAGCVASELLKLRTAAKCLRQACLLVRELDDRGAYEAVFSNYAGVLSELGRADEAAETIKHVQDSPIGSRRWSHLTYLTNHAHLCLALGRPRDCWRSLSAACEQFLATPDPYGLSAMYATAAWACVQVGAVLEGRVLAAAHAAIVQHFALILSPRQQKSKDMVEWLAQTNSNKPSAWSPDSPLDILKNVLHNHAPSQ
jgi:tetratricopeptide (TPR) repeat protein